GGVSDQQQRDWASEHYERGRKFLAEEYFPVERCDQFIYRGKKVIIVLLDEVERYASHGQTAAGHGKERGSAFTQDKALNAAMSELRTVTLLERFANGASMDGVFDASNALIYDARRDEEFRNWFHRLNQKRHFAHDGAT
ncbi:hypothetical protein P692DRAFT_20823953, partial [Suillus brevipes Sb2]